MSSSWGWNPPRDDGIWRHCPPWLRPFVAASPWLAVAVSLLMILFVGNTLTVDQGVLFDLPDADSYEGSPTQLTAIVMPKGHDTIVFFDDSRYSVEDDSSLAAFGRNLAEKAARTRDRSMLVLADRRVSSGMLMRFAAVAKRSGVGQLLFAEKREARKSE